MKVQKIPSSKQLALNIETVGERAMQRFGQVVKLPNFPKMLDIVVNGLGTPFAPNSLSTLMGSPTRTFNFFVKNWVCKVVKKEGPIQTKPHHRKRKSILPTRHCPSLSVIDRFEQAGCLASTLEI